MSVVLSDRELEAIASIFLGEQIGEGIARRVFACAMDERYVVKLEPPGKRDWQNIAEWDLWINARPALARWLAPCVFISADGTCLVQERCQPIPETMVPKKIPPMLDDTHLGNWGWLPNPDGRGQGRVVMFDYGRHLALQIAQNVRRFKDTDVYD